jgi:predicted DNA-binding transcriptional regulator AlpA
MSEDPFAALDATSPALLNEDQAAARLGLTASDLYQRRRRGDGPPFVRLKNRIFYVTGDLDAWVAALPRFQSSTEGFAAQRLAGAALAKREAKLRKAASGGRQEAQESPSAREEGVDAIQPRKGRHGSSEATQTQVRR